MQYTVFIVVARIGNDSRTAFSLLQSIKFGSFFIWTVNPVNGNGVSRIRVLENLVEGKPATDDIGREVSRQKIMSRSICSSPSVPTKILKNARKFSSSHFAYDVQFGTHQTSDGILTVPTVPGGQCDPSDLLSKSKTKLEHTVQY
jgi:hypothetical protein